jgi:ATP-dependent RNA helicase DOB1
MSGRAGRRGKDDRGIVIQMLDESMEPEVAKGMLYGDPDALYSSYHLGYNMVLNMLRVEDADPENILRASFHQYQQEQQSPEFEQQADELQRSAVAITIPEEGVIAEYYAWCKQLEKTQHEVMTITLNPKYCLPFFQMGRLVSVGSLLNAEHNWGWGIVAQCRKTGSKVSTMSDIVEDIIGADDANPAEYILDVLLEVRPLTSEEGKNSTLDNTYGIKGIRPVSSGTKVPGIKPVMIVVQVALHAITGISAVRLNIPKDLRKEQARANSHKAILEVKRRFSPKGSNDGSLIPLLDPVDDLGIVDDSFTELSKRCTEMRTRLADCAFHRLPEQMVRPKVDGSEDSEVSLTRSEWLLEYEKKIQLLEEARKFRQLSRESQAVTMRDELKKMRKVLRRSGFITADGVLETKGRFSCELSTADELVVTDMVFDGVFNELTTEQTVSLLSCFVHSEPSKEGAANVRPDLQKIYTQLQVVARKIAKVRIDAKIAVDEEEYVKSFNPELMEVCYAWCAGAKFSEVCRLTEVFEGSIIRVIRRLEELLRQLASASMAIGNTDLKAKFEEGADKIRRGVVFTASLYL